METKVQGKRQRFPLFQIILIVVLLSLVWYTFGSTVLNPASQNQSVVPEHLGELRLVNHTEGEDALAQIDKLHGTSIKLADAFIVEYAKDRERITVWAGEAENSSGAIDLISRMVAGMQKGNSSFGSPRQLTMDGREVWQVDARGGKFFFYQSSKPDNRVVWLTIQANDDVSLLERAIKVF